MAMLAERKRKQKWSLNPRGKHWSDDVNKFGQKMLEKMGWSAGKGLGRHENGMTEHVKVNYKNDSRGMGFKDNGEQWTKHENNFTSLLESLGGSGNNSDTTIQKPDRSLEEKSRSSRARVHYHKFTRGKDLSLKSEKDLANIFGRKTLERPVEPEKVPTPEPETSENKEFGVVTVAAGSMADYFKSKLGKISNAFTNGNKNTQDDGSESESEIGTCTGFGFGAGSQATNQCTNFVSASTNNEQNGTSKTENIDTDAIEVVKEEPDSNEEQKSEKKRKRKREEDEDEAQLEIKSKKLKKKKKKLAFDNAGLDVNVDEEVCYDNPCLEELNVATNAISDPEPTNSNVFINLGFNPVDESGTKKKKKVTFASPEADDGTKKNNENIIEEETPRKSKKKKKKSNDEEIGIDNPACEVLNLDDTIQYEEVAKPKKSKKKNKNKDESVNNESCEVMSAEETAEDISNETETAKKLKKSKKRQNEIDIIEDEVDTPKKAKKKTKKVENGIDNLACVVNIVEEGVASINSAIDNYQTELENEINERKADMKSSRIPNKRVNNRFDDRNSLKNLVTPGQLKLKFSGANLDTIPGYGVEI